MTRQTQRSLASGFGVAALALAVVFAFSDGWLIAAGNLVVALILFYGVSRSAARDGGSTPEDR